MLIFVCTFQLFRNVLSNRHLVTCWSGPSGFSDEICPITTHESLILLVHMYAVVWANLAPGKGIYSECLREMNRLLTIMDTDLVGHSLHITNTNALSRAHPKHMTINLQQPNILRVKPTDANIECVSTQSEVSVVSRRLGLNHRVPWQMSEVSIFL